VNLNHLHLSARQPESTRRFYETYFGFRPHLQLGETVVLVNAEHFLLAIDPRGDSTDASPPPLHFGFCVGRPEEVDALYQAMRQGGVVFTQELRVMSPNARSFYCWDPAGNQVEVGWYKKLNFTDQR
jgi:catechol 2,3-dioxygenase-like lactoylglutathione lyase family enzyme